jgi:polyvinyl alcohol dehydrogenase (cytochrome)
VAGGRVYTGVDTGFVYALDAAAGCVYWSFEAEAGVRTAITIARITPTRYAAWFGDVKAGVYAVDAATGELIWKTRVEDHPTARITGAPKVFEGRLYVPVASSEEGAGGNPKYPCCTFRGSVTALDAATGRQIWKTYTISDVPQPVEKTAAGPETGNVPRWGPAGGGVWSSPTIDVKRRALYIGSGDAYTEPAAKTTDAIIAMDLDSGKIQWIVQGTENDAWLRIPPGTARRIWAPITTLRLHRFSRPSRMDAAYLSPARRAAMSGRMIRTRRAPWCGRRRW